MGIYSSVDGDVLVKAARYAIDIHLKSPKFDEKMVEKILSKYTERQGVFVTLEHYPTMSLRGSAGAIKPDHHLGKGLVHAAIGAATDDKRFVSVSQQEFQEIIVAVSLVGSPQRINRTTAFGKLNEIKLGRDGLIISYGFREGIVLPTEAVDNKWGKTRLLDALCAKAGLPEGAWKRPDVSLYKFSAQTFKETAPEGEVREVRG